MAAWDTQEQSAGQRERIQSVRSATLTRHMDVVATRRINADPTIVFRNGLCKTVPSFLV
jgi:hypothetical protein